MNNNVKDKMSVFYQLRQKFGFSQEEFARLLGVSFTTVNRWENGRQTQKMSLKQWKIITLLLIGAGIKPQDLPDDDFGTIKNLKLPDTTKTSNKI